MRIGQFGGFDFGEGGRSVPVRCVAPQLEAHNDRQL
jgi:hypothetical protein